MHKITFYTCCLALLASTVLASPPVNILDSSIYKQHTKKPDQRLLLGQHVSDYLYLKLSEKDKDILTRVVMKALEFSPSFLTHKWQNIDTGHKGQVSIMPVFDQDGHKCRKFKATIYISDEEFNIENSACRINNNWCITQ